MLKKTLLILAVTTMLAATPAVAATKSYQVTGPVLELTADSLVVQKGKEKWEIARGNVALPADVKVGSKITVQYTMTAVAVEEKAVDAKKK